MPTVEQRGERRTEARTQQNDTACRKANANLIAAAKELS
jgi:hypothetical protein